MKLRYWLIAGTLLVLFCGWSSLQSSARWRTVQATGECTARSECALAVAGEKLYLMGGRRVQGVDVYDPLSSTWAIGAEAPIEMHHFQAVTYDDKVYVMGALTGAYPREDPVPVIYIYDPMEDRWMVGDSIPAHRRRGAAGVAVVGDKIYLACGIQDGHYDGHVTWLDRYDPKTGAWEELADAPRARDHFQLAAVGDQLFIAGGRTSSAKTGHVFDLTISEVDVYDIGTGQWRSHISDIPTQRAGCTSVTFGQQFVVIGGESASIEEGHYEAEVFDPVTNGWYSSHPLIDGRHGMQAVLFDDNIYLAAGAGNRGGGPELTSIEVISASGLFSR
ncbi:MAG: kelch repeat-containing protein [Bacteroidota bacterium]